jgi:hypothetical protein
MLEWLQRLQAKAGEQMCSPGIHYEFAELGDGDWKIAIAMHGLRRAMGK